MYSKGGTNLPVTGGPDSKWLTPFASSSERGLGGSPTFCLLPGLTDGPEASSGRDGWWGGGGFAGNSAFPEL